MITIASAAVSADGYLDDCSPCRLVLSTAGDWDEVYRLRASCDAILVGAGTLRADNPSLQIKDPALRSERESQGRDPDILRVSVSRSGQIDPTLRFFTGPGRALIFVEQGADVTALRQVADVVVAPQITPSLILEELERRGVQRLMIEGGEQTLRLFFAAGVVDEFRLAISPLAVGNAGRARLVKCGDYAFENMTLRSIREVDGMQVREYINSDRAYLRGAIEESRRCTPAATSYSVGAVIVTDAGEIFRGFTHETAPTNHAEEEAIQKALDAGAELRGATIYSSMEPCSTRSSKPKSCSELIIEHGFAKVVFALFEPDCFVRCQGEGLLRGNGIRVEVHPDLGGLVQEINSHIIR